MTINESVYIVKSIGEPAALEQLAEECAELAQAALKLARVLRAENPTPVTEEDAREDLREEIGDVRLCIRVLDEAVGDVINENGEKFKLARWKARAMRAEEEKKARIEQAKERYNAKKNDNSR